MINQSKLHELINWKARFRPNPSSLRKTLLNGCQRNPFKGTLGLWWRRVLGKLLNPLCRNQKRPTLTTALILFIMMRFSLLVCLLVLWLNVDVSLSQNDPLGCGTPPTLPGGGAVESLRFTYSHGETVKYACQGLNTMEGELYKTCENGEWTGEMRCLKPCIVSKEIMDGHNIVFRFSNRQKMYLRHNDDVQFRCKGQTRHDHVLSMRQRCADGVMQFPDCF